MRKIKGFTLIELAIVLIIIGIILAAVLKGQDLIANAKAKRIAGQIRGIEAAIWAFYDKFGYLPGDTDGNGTIDDSIAAWGNLTYKYNYSTLASNNSVVGESYTVAGNETEKINYIIISNLPGYIAMMVDGHIDGIANGSAGRFLRNDTTAWPNDNTLVTARYYFDRLP